MLAWIVENWIDLLLAHCFFGFLAVIATNKVMIDDDYHEWSPGAHVAAGITVFFFLEVALGLLALVGAGWVLKNCWKVVPGFKELWVELVPTWDELRAAIGLPKKPAKLPKAVAKETKCAP